MSGVTALSGSMPSEPGRIVIILQISATQAPDNILKGNNVEWSDVPSIKRAMCGTASPIKETGPQNAVAVAVSSPVQSRINKRVRLILMPRLAAYISPNNMAFRGFMSKTERKIPVSEMMTKKGNRSLVTAEKSPIPHIT